MRTILLTLSLSLLSVFVLAQNKHSKKIIDWYEQNKFEEIIQYKKNNTKIFNTDALFYKGMAYFAFEDYNKSIEYIDLAMEKGPEKEQMYYYKGLGFYYLDEQEKAEECFQSAYKKYPGETIFLALIGDTYFQRNKLDTAIIYLEEAAKYGDADARVFLILGDIYQQKKDYKNSIQSFTKGLDKVEEGDEYYQILNYNLGLTQQIAEKYEDAKRTFEKQLKLYPDDISALTKIIQVSNALGQFEYANEKKVLMYEAYKDNKIPSHMSNMFCVDQFAWDKNRVMIFEVFEEFENMAEPARLKIFVSDEEGELLNRILFRMDSTNTDSNYIFCQAVDDTLQVYSKTFSRNPELKVVKDQVFAILNDTASIQTTIPDYTSFLNKQQAKFSKVANLERDGTSYEKAVIVNSVSDEYKWLRKYYPGSTFIQQSLNFHEGQPYDILKIRTAEGTTIDVYFDISKFFGKGF